MKKILWTSLGLFFVFMAYLGAITPGLPTTFFAILAAWAFSKSSPKLDAWLRNHKWFGKHISNWEEKRIYPFEGKMAMLIFMCVSISFSILWLPLKATIWMAIFFILVFVWANRFPSDKWEWEQRKRDGKKIGWIK